MVKTKSALKILDNLTGGDLELQNLIDEETVNARIARLIYEARSEAQLTQKQLAELVGTKQPVIVRLEDADYEGHSLSMLTRIATALNRRIAIDFLPTEERREPAQSAL